MQKPPVKVVPAFFSAVDTTKRNYKKGRLAKIDRVVIHTQQGTEKGTEAWFASPDAHASAHYAVSFEGKIVQFVNDEDTAWHAGSSSFNARSIGIELEGFEERAFFPDPMMQHAAQLVAWLCLTYGITVDREHIIGHCEVPDEKHPGQYGGTAHHKDPGAGFPWDKLMQLVHSTIDASKLPPLNVA